MVYKSRGKTRPHVSVFVSIATFLLQFTFPATGDGEYVAMYRCSRLSEHALLRENREKVVQFQTKKDGPG